MKTTCPGGLGAGGKRGRRNRDRRRDQAAHTQDRSKAKAHVSPIVGQLRARDIRTNPRVRLGTLPTARYASCAKPCHVWCEQNHHPGKGDRMDPFGCQQAQRVVCLQAQHQGGRVAMTGADQR